MQNRKQYLAIDLLKFIFAMSVLIIHFQPLMDFSVLAHRLSADGLARLAVPFFLMSTGFFTSAETLADWPALKLRLWKLFKLWGYWSLVYLPLRVLGIVFSEQNLLDNLQFFVRDVFFQGVFIHLWYVPAVMLSLFVMHQLGKKLSLRSLLGLSFGLFVLGSLGDAYYHLLPTGSWIQSAYAGILDVAISTRSGLFFAFFFVALGHRMRTLNPKQRPETLFFWFLASLIVLYGELWMLISVGEPFDYNMRLGLIPSAITLFVWAKSVDLETRWSGEWMRSMSTAIYFSHFLIFYLLMTLVTITNLWVLVSHSFLRFGLTLALTLLYSRWLLKRAQRKAGLARRLLEG